MYDDLNLSISIFIRTKMGCICSKDDNYRQPYMYVPERDTKTHLTTGINNEKVKSSQTYFRSYIGPASEKNSYTHI